MRLARRLPWLVLIALFLAAALPAQGNEPPPEPRFSGIDYARPAAHLTLSPKMGDAPRIQSIAGQLKGATPRATLASIHQWMHRNLRHDDRAGKCWRTFAEALGDRTYGSCADHAAMFGTLARAAGIPTVWVKTMDLDWIEDFRAGRREAQTYRGHVFLEVHVDGAWRLLDAQAMRLYAGAYDPVGTRVLPGNRFAYDKGDDPFALVLSCRWDLWKRQTDAYFSSLDPSLIPWGRSEDLLQPWRVWIAGNLPLYKYASEACKRLGFHVMKTFNQNWERHLANARGKTLVVTCRGRQPVLPESYRSAVLPPGYRAFVAGTSAPKDGYLKHTLPDGTRVILVTGQDLTSIQVGVAKALAEPH